MEGANDARDEFCPLFSVLVGKLATRSLLFRILLRKLCLELFHSYFCASHMRHTLESLITQIIPLSITHSGNSFMLVVGEQTIKQSTCEFLLTFSTMVGTDIEAYISNLSNEYDEVRVPLSARGDAVVLSLPDFARLRSIYGEMMYKLKLQDLLVRNAIALPAALASVE
jgi:hypothetical protein